METVEGSRFRLSHPKLKSHVGEPDIEVKELGYTVRVRVVLKDIKAGAGQPIWMRGA